MKTFVEWSGFGGIVSHSANSLRDSSVLRQIIGDEEYDKLMNGEEVEARQDGVLSESSCGSNHEKKETEEDEEEVEAE